MFNVVHEETAFNVICSADEQVWENSPARFLKSRVFEYTDKGMLAQLSYVPGEVPQQVRSLPTLFMYEDMVGKDAFVGSINSIRDGSDWILIDFDRNGDFQPINNESLFDLEFELGLQPFQFSRTHWSIKRGNLLQILEDRGLRIPKQSVLKKQPPERPKKESGKKTTKVFVSYSHADAEFLERLKIHLKPLENSLDLEIWSDTKLVGGDNWKSEIEAGLAEASVAILIVSADFLASDFITKFELPPLLENYEERGCRIIPLVAKPCFFSVNQSISKFQAVNDPKKEALQSLPHAKQEEIYSKVTELVYDLAK